MPWPNYKPPPAPPAPADDETPIQYGARIVRHMIANDYTTIGLTDEQITIADHAINDLLARQPKPDETIAPCYFETLNACRRRLTTTQALRAETRERAERMKAGAQADDDDNGGQKEPRRPLAPVQPPPTLATTPAPLAPRRPAPIDF